MFTEDLYSRRASRNVRAALALALRRHLEGLDFDAGGNVFRFAQVFDDWPSFLERYVPPSACVLPGRTTYLDALMTPTLLEDTWEPQGQQGFGLYKLSEVSLDLEVSFRAPTVAERDAILHGLEDSFVSGQILMDQVNGPRYGRLLEMPEYYGLCGRFALASSQVIDDPDHALREQRDAIVTVSAQAAHVKLGPVYPFNLTFQIDPYDP